MEKPINFETKPLKEYIELMQWMDKQCFPEEMWLDEKAAQALIKAGAEATVLKLDTQVIGLAVTLTEEAANQFLSDVDEKFSVMKEGIYSYSEAILPEFQNQGYGSLLLLELSDRMRERGYKYISAHVRTIYGWHLKRYRRLLIAETRSVNNFWEDVREGAVEFQLAIL